MATTLDGVQTATLSFPIVRKEYTPEGDLLIWGKATDGTVDSDKQIVDTNWSGKALHEWLQTGGNVRVQHSPHLYPAGKGVEVEVSKDGAHWVRSLIVEKTAKDLVEKGVLTAYSIGIAQPQIIRSMEAPGGKIVGGIIAELSLVDRPANKNCGFELCKSDSSGQPEFVGKMWGDVPTTTTFTPNDLAGILGKRDFSQAQRDAAADSGAAMPDGSFPIKNGSDLQNAIGLAGNASDPAAAKRHIKSRAAALGLSDKIPDTWKGVGTDVVKGEKDCPECGTGHDADSKARSCRNCGSRLPRADKSADADVEERADADLEKGQVPPQFAEHTKKPGDQGDDEADEDDDKPAFLQGKSAQPTDGVRAKDSKPLPRHREPDGGVVGDFEADAGLAEGGADESGGQGLPNGIWSESRSSNTPDTMKGDSDPWYEQFIGKVGPKGYSHGWVYHGAPGALDPASHRGADKTRASKYNDHLSQIHAKEGKKLSAQDHHDLYEAHRGAAKQALRLGHNDRYGHHSGAAHQHLTESVRAAAKPGLAPHVPQHREAPEGHRLAAGGRFGQTYVDPSKLHQGALPDKVTMAPEGQHGSEMQRRFHKTKEGDFEERSASGGSRRNSRGGASRFSESDLKDLAAMHGHSFQPVAKKNGTNVKKSFGGTEVASYPINRLHDALCAAYTPDDVASEYPAMKGLTGALNDAWDDLDAESRVIVKTLAEVASLDGTTTDGLILDDARVSLSKAFGDMYPNTRVTPGKITAGQFTRPYLSEGHPRLSIQSPGHMPGPGDASFGSTETMRDASQFNRSNITGGHARTSPGSGGNNGNSIPGSRPAGARLAAAAKAEAANSMQQLHDRLAEHHPYLCPMSPGSPGELNAVSKAETEALREQIETLQKSHAEQISELRAMVDQMASQPDPQAAPHRGVTVNKSASGGTGPVDRRSLVEEAKTHETKERSAFYAQIAASGDVGLREAARSILNQTPTE